MGASTPLRIPPRPEWMVYHHPLGVWVLDDDGRPLHLIASSAPRGPIPMTCVYCDARLADEIPPADGDDTTVIYCARCHGRNAVTPWRAACLGLDRLRPTPPPSWLAGEGLAAAQAQRVAWRGAAAAALAAHNLQHDPDGPVLGPRRAAQRAAAEARRRDDRRPEWGSDGS